MTTAWAGLAIYLMSEDTELTVGVVLGCIGAGLIMNVLTMPILVVIVGYSIANIWHIKYLIDIAIIRLSGSKKQ
jgi:hypothetical protein